MLRPILIVLALAASSLASGEPIGSHCAAGLRRRPGRFQGAQEVRPPPYPTGPLFRAIASSTERGVARSSLGTATLRLDECSASVSDLDDTTVRVELDRGTASVNLSELLETRPSQSSRRTRP